MGIPHLPWLITSQVSRGVSYAAQSPHQESAQPLILVDVTWVLCSKTSVVLTYRKKMWSEHASDLFHVCESAPLHPPLVVRMHAPPTHTNICHAPIFAATFTFVVRSFTVLDGIGKSLDPRFDISEIAAPYARELLLDGNPVYAKLASDFRKRAANQVGRREGWGQWREGGLAHCVPVNVALCVSIPVMVEGGGEGGGCWGRGGGVEVGGCELGAGVEEEVAPWE